MKITIVGTGYVGLVTGTCFSEMGNFVTCIDIDEAKLDKLRKGIIPIHEPGLENMISRNTAAGRLSFSSDLASSMNDSAVVMIAVGTPPNEDGSADLSHVLAVAREIGEKLENPVVVVDKSTVPVGTADKVRETIAEAMTARGVDITFDVVSNPEFLKEGAAVGDFMSPDRIVVGCEGERPRAVMEELYAPFSRNHDKLHFMGLRDAEMTKYAANAMLATKISFMNEIALMCDRFGVDVENVRKGIGSDPRIGYSFIYPGTGYGGSCFPKDVRALITMADHIGVEADVFRAVESRNRSQKTILMDKLTSHYGDVSGKHFIMWGLAFKPETDDVREAPAIDMIRLLTEAGATVSAYDPEATHTAKDSLGDVAVNYMDDPYSEMSNADALLVMTEWKVFRQPDFDRLAQLRDKVIFDGRNIYEPAIVSRYGITYYGIGRQSA